MRSEHGEHAVVALSDDAGDLAVNVLLGVFAVLPGHEGLRLQAEIGSATPSQGDMAESIGHAVIGDHAPGYSVALVRSLAAPVEIRANAICSAARPPRRTSI